MKQNLHRIWGVYRSWSWEIVQVNTAGKVSVFGDFLVRNFPAFWLNTERYGACLCILFKCGKVRTRKTPNTDTFHALKPSCICLWKNVSVKLLTRLTYFMSLIFFFTPWEHRKGYRKRPVAKELIKNRHKKNGFNLLFATSA